MYGRMVLLQHGIIIVNNYDKDGNVRINPARTTFNLTEEANAHPYYSPDAEVKDGESFGEVVGNVTIMFNFNTDEEKSMVQRH